MWNTPADAFLSQYPNLTSDAPRCTIPPNTLLQVLRPDVGFRITMLDTATQARVNSSGISTGAGEDVAQVASPDGQCAGFAPASALK